MNTSRLNISKPLTVGVISNTNSTKKRNDEEARKRREADLEEKRKKDRGNK